jgi:Methyltransferase domain
MSLQGASSGVQGLGLEFPTMLQHPSELGSVVELVELNLGRHPRSVLEIGVHLGGTISRFRHRWPGAAMIGVDLVEPAPIEGVQFVVGDSMAETTRAEVERLWPEPFDFVHIDGDHTLTACTADYEWARDRLQARMVALHDVAIWDPMEGALFEVWKLWHEIKLSGVPAVEIRHNAECRFGYGLVMCRG